MLSTIRDDIAEVLITEELLQARVRQLGKEISRDYREILRDHKAHPEPVEGKPLLLVGILKGAAVFLADLLRAIDVPVDYDFVAISSYGNGTQSSGAVEIKKGVDVDVSGRHVLIVEDIVDTGWTLRLSYIKEKLLASNAASVRVCALLDKPSRRQVDVEIDYRGFVIEDRFVVGYGLDRGGRYRNLPFIGVLKSV